MEEKLTRLLVETLHPEFLEIINTSHMHQGHAGSPNTGQSHFTVRIRAVSLAGLTRVAAHRQIMTCVAPLFQEGLHALSLELVAYS